MIYRTLGKTGWKVSAVGQGTWGIGGQWGPVERQTALDAIRASHDAGVTFFDTADIYGFPQGLSEELLGEALRPVRGDVIIASKAGYWGSRFGHVLPFSHPSHVELCCDASLHRLKTDVIDVYQCHVGDLRDPSVFLEAFEGLVRRGKIRAYGVSTHSMRVAQAFNRDGKCATLQVDYSILNRTAEETFLPFCRQNNIGVIVRGPLAQGMAAGKFTRDTRFDDVVRAGWNEGPGREQFFRMLETVERVRPLERPGRSLAQLAIQFVISHEAVAVAIPGAKTPEQARTNAAAGNAVLDSSELQRVREAAPIPVPPKPGVLSIVKKVAKKALRRN
jgi:aryl-alcohol dehydrogenase-like predicted oxidoreductase